MNFDNFIYEMPIWATALLTASLIVFSLWLGHKLGLIRRRNETHESEGSVGPIVGSVLGLLAFLLAINFGMTGNRFEARRRLLLEDVNAIGTAYLRTDFLPDAQGAEIRKLLREYVDIRASVGTPRQMKLKQALERSDKLLDDMWAQTTTAVGAQSKSIAEGLFIYSLNDVIDNHTKRITVAFQYRIPTGLWLAFYLLSMIAMTTVGYQFGLANKTSPLALGLLTIAFTVAITLIAFIDHGGESMMFVEQQPMLDLQQKLHSDTRHMEERPRPPKAVF